ncbi:SulP family inorganic anion transporter [Myceligenerans indicum]|uniref:SulP family inorganic anion transporter n=1 Tax=Myceligenerans indicum TaxID=2593663 RepID=A0ABS1LIJ3_9MICO|nr:SulP family inorganic anion transporter [Myceligenerans indicum]MBL0885964.1 SulP family inorganic anion transporter [Myceligenerans indicum]
MTARDLVARLDLRGLLPTRTDYDLRPRTFRADLAAGITVGVVALPLALAFGISSGVGPAAGLVTAVIAGVVAAVFGGSNVQVSGPTGAMAVVLAPIVARHGLGSVALVTVGAGLIVLTLGILRLGRVVTYLPWPVVEGFTLGIAAIIFLQQIPHALAVAAQAGHNTFVTALVAIADAVREPDAATLWTLGIVAAVVAIMVLLPRISRGLPASLVAVTVVTVAAELAGAPAPRIDQLPSALPVPHLPGITPDAVRDVFGAMIAIAALAAIESLLSARVAATMPTDRGGTGPYEPDRELVGQGLASVASGMFGGMPATGAIARTAVNVRSGGRTRLAAVVHSLVVLGVIYLATGPVSRIPLAALAGVLMVTSFRMVHAATVRAVLTSTRSDAATFVVTAIITVAFDLIEAVQIGLLVAAFLTLRHIARASSVHRDPLPGLASPGDEHIALYRLEGAMFFGASGRILDEVTRASRRDDVRVVILRLSQVRLVDATGANALAELITELEQRGVTVLVKGVQDRHRTLLVNVGALQRLRHESHLFTTLDAAITHARSHVDREARPAPGDPRHATA